VKSEVYKFSSGLENKIIKLLRLLNSLSRLDGGSEVFGEGSHYPGLFIWLAFNVTPTQIGHFCDRLLRKGSPNNENDLKTQQPR